MCIYIYILLLLLLLLLLISLLILLLLLLLLFCIFLKELHLPNIVSKDARRNFLQDAAKIVS